VRDLATLDAVSIDDSNDITKTPFPAISLVHRLSFLSWALRRDVPKMWVMSGTTALQVEVNLCRLKLILMLSKKQKEIK
jgi:hypothetical protein